MKARKAQANFFTSDFNTSDLVSNFSLIVS